MSTPETAEELLENAPVNESGKVRVSLMGSLTVDAAYAGALKLLEKIRAK